MSLTTVRVPAEMWKNIVSLMSVASVGANVKTLPNTHRPGIVAVKQEDGPLVRGWVKAFKGGAEFAAVRDEVEILTWAMRGSDDEPPAPVLDVLKSVVADWGWDVRYEPFDTDRPELGGNLIMTGRYGGIPEHLRQPSGGLVPDWDQKQSVILGRWLGKLRERLVEAHNNGTDPNDAVAEPVDD